MSESAVPPAEPHTGGDGVVDILEEAGVRVVFGIPSVHNLPIYDALARRGTIRAITVRHEQTAAAAADGYARTTGEVGVFVTSTGPGAANAMGGLLEAFVSGSPVVHLTGQIETRYLDECRGFIHEVPDQPAMLSSLSKRVYRAVSPDDIGVVVDEAIRVALAHPQGPVSVELPIDLQYAGAAPARRAPERQSAKSDPAGLDKAVDLLSAARRPIIWAGGGVVRSGAEADVAELARRAGAGVLTSPNARGVLPEDDPLCIGNLPWDPDVRALVLESDLLIGIGTRYQGPNTENWKMALPGNLLQIDVDPSIPGRNYPAAAALAGDARRVVSSLLRRLESAGAEPAWAARIAEVTASARARLRRTLGAQEGLLDELASAITDQTVVVKDSTIPAYTWGNRLLPVSRTRRAIMPNGFAIGLGLAHAVGAAAASVATGSGEPVVCMAGDGGFMLTAADLATIAQEQLPVVTLIFNDGGYGILRNIQDRQYERRIGVELGRPDFCQLAQALGVGAERVGSAEGFGKAVRGALERRAPHLIEVDLEQIGPMARPYTGTSRPPQGATNS